MSFSLHNVMIVSLFVLQQPCKLLVKMLILVHTVSQLKLTDVHFQPFLVASQKLQEMERSSGESTLSEREPSISVMKATDCSLVNCQQLSARKMGNGATLTGLHSVWVSVLLYIPFNCL